MITGGVGAIPGTNTNFNDLEIAGKLLKSIQAGIVASAVQAQGQQPLTKDLNEIATAASPGDAVTLPEAEPRRQIFIINNSANNVSVYPAAGDQIKGAGINNPWTLPGNTAAIYTAYDATNWDAAEQGDISAVIAGTNLTGGGTGGSVTLNLSDNVDISGNMIARGVIAGDSAEFGSLTIRTTTDPGGLGNLLLEAATIKTDAPIRAIQTVQGRPAVMMDRLVTRNLPAFITHDDNLNTGFGGPNSGAITGIINGVPNFEFNAGVFRANVLANDIDFGVNGFPSGGCFFDAALGLWSFGAFAFPGFFSVIGYADQKQLVTRGHSTQADTNNIFEVQKNDGSRYFAVDGSGKSLLYTIAGISASTTQTQGNGALTAQNNEVSTVANENDTVTLPSVKAGLVVTVINNGANALQIFPASGHDLGNGTNNPKLIAPGAKAEFVGFSATNWCNGRVGKIQLLFGSGNVSATTTTRWLHPGFSDATAPTSIIEVPAIKTGIVRNLRILQNGNIGNGNNIVYTLQKNGANTALTVTIASNAKQASDTTNQVSVAAGDLLSIVFTKAATVGSAPTDVYAVMELEGT